MADNFGVKAALNVLADQGELGKPLQSALFEEQQEQQIEPTEKRGRGRPKGARNRSTNEVVAELVANHGDPLLNLAKLASASHQELLSQGIEAKDLIKFKANCWKELLPFVHAKKIEVKGEGVAPLVINLGNYQDQDDDDDVRIVGLVDEDGKVIENNNLDVSLGNDLEQVDLEQGEESKAEQGIQEDRAAD